MSNYYIFCSRQAKERQKKKGGTKGIRVDADGGVTLEDFADNANGFESTADPADKGKSSKKVNIFPIYFEWNNDFDSYDLCASKVTIYIIFRITSWKTEVNGSITS